jgi:hypothetical protein
VAERFGADVGPIVAAFEKKAEELHRPFAAKGRELITDVDRANSVRWFVRRCVHGPRRWLLADRRLAHRGPTRGRRSQRRASGATRRARAPGRSTDDPAEPARRALTRLLVVPCPVAAR